MATKKIKSPEAQLQMAMATLGLAFAKVLVERDPSLLWHLQAAVDAAYHELNDGDDMEAAIPLGMLSRALYNKTLFPSKAGNND